MPNRILSTSQISQRNTCDGGLLNIAVTLHSDFQLKVNLMEYYCFVYKNLLVYNHEIAHTVKTFDETDTLLEGLSCLGLIFSLH